MNFPYIELVAIIIGSLLLGYAGGYKTAETDRPILIINDCPNCPCEKWNTVGYIPLLHNNQCENE